MDQHANVAIPRLIKLARLKVFSSSFERSQGSFIYIEPKPLKLYNMRHPLSLDPHWDQDIFCKTYLTIT